MIKTSTLRFCGIAFVLLTCIRCTAQEQADELQGFKGFSTPAPMRNEGIIKLSPYPLFDGQIDFTGELRVGYERRIAKRQSITVSFSYDYPNFILLAVGRSLGGGRGRRGAGGMGRGGSFNSYSIEGGRVTLGYRYYPLKKLPGLNGFFVGPFLSFNAVNIRDKTSSADYEVVNYANASAITGYQLVTKNHFELEVFGGFGYKNNFVLHYDSDANSIYQGYGFNITGHVKFDLQMNFGYAF